MVYGETLEWLCERTMQFNNAISLGRSPSLRPVLSATGSCRRLSIPYSLPFIYYLSLTSEEAV